jgi:PAS domain-containing protein
MRCGWLALLWGCAGGSGEPDRGPAPVVDDPAPVLRRLTVSQYRNSVRDLFGEGLVLPANLEPDVPIDGLIAIGAGQTTISPYGVEQYEAAAFQIAGQVLGDPARRAAFVPCQPASPRDDGCARQVLEPLGRRVWRRPLEAAELDDLVALAGTSADALGDFHEGLEFPVALLLQSPNFLYRVELGDGSGAYTDHELAGRLSFLLWDTLPDEELFAAADAGELTTEAGLSAQVDRMLADPRARAGVRTFFTDLFHLHALDRISKDPNAFVAYSPELRDSAREQTLLGLEDLIFERDGSYRDLFDSRIAFVDRRLAALYGVRAPDVDGFAPMLLPLSAGRVGLLGQASILMLEAHPVSSSVTKRGVFVRETVLCQEIPPPPANVDTSIPEASEAAPTMRERVARHLEEDACAACHRLTDPIGLGLENYDGIGAWRQRENGAVIDASGDLDGEAYTTPQQLGALLAEHPSIAKCLVDRVAAAAWGVDPLRDDPTVVWHNAGFDANGDRVLWLLRDIVTAPAFRRVGSPE